MKSVNPYINFNRNTEEAFTFYREVFGGEFWGVIRFKDFGIPDLPPEDLELIAHIALPLKEDALLLGSDVLESLGHTFKAGNNSYINIEAESAAEAEQLYAALSAGGAAHMPLQLTEWAEKFGICVDKFGVQWMINFPGSADFWGN